MKPAKTRRATILMQACPRCLGSLYLDLLEEDEEFVCLQCGRRALREQLDAGVRARLDSQRRLTAA